MSSEELGPIDVHLVLCQMGGWLLLVVSRPGAWHVISLNFIITKSHTVGIAVLILQIPKQSPRERQELALKHSF